MKSDIREEIYNLAHSLHELALDSCRKEFPDEVHWLVTEQRKLGALERMLERRGMLSSR